MTQSKNSDDIGIVEDIPIAHHLKGKWRDLSPVHFIHEHQTELENKESDAEADMLQAALALSKEVTAHHSMSGLGPSTTAGLEQKGDILLSDCSISSMRNGFPFGFCSD